MKKMPIIKVDLSLPPEERWQHLSKYMRRAGRTLARRTVAEMGNERLRILAGHLVDAATVARNPYRDEIFTLARLMGTPRRQALTANFAYEVNQVACWGFDLWEKHSPRIAELWEQVRSTPSAVLDSVRTGIQRGMACTAGAAYYPKLGMVHVRTLDWDLQGMGRHAVIWHCVGATAGEYFSIGWPGYVGVLSGMAPGRFSATINQAFPVSTPTLEWPPSHLLRYVFENCGSYGDALATLEATPVCFPAFVMLVGVKPGEAAVVELTTKRNVIHRMNRKRQPIAIANDYLTGEWRSEFDLSGKTLRAHERGEWSEHRRNRMLVELKRRRPSSIGRAMSSIQTDWIENECTMQQMAFLPATGELLVIGLEDQKSVAIGGVSPSK